MVKQVLLNNRIDRKSCRFFDILSVVDKRAGLTRLVQLEVVLRLVVALGKYGLCQDVFQVCSGLFGEEVGCLHV